MTPIEWIVMVLVAVGLLFFAGGTLGLLRFPDVYNRLHALTKADNVGLGFVVVGLAVHDGTWSSSLKHLLVWMLVLTASTTACHLIARHALHEGIEPWRKP
jgi:multicomponent Na+:H+ antiporter subunit G